MPQAPEDEERAAQARLEALKGELARRRAAGRAAERERTTGGSATAASGWSLGTRMSGEFVGAIVAGGLIGYGLDRWLGTTPWLLIAFFLLGAAAGVRGVIRAASPKGRDDDRNSRLSASQAPDKDVPRSASGVEPQAPSGWDVDED